MLLFKSCLMPSHQSTYSLLPPGLDLTCQILISIGKLIAVWANCETCFYAIYFCLGGRSNGNADVTWASVLSTRRRLTMLHHLVRYEDGVDDQTKNEILKCLQLFDALTAVRNYYCHARYRTAEDGETILSIDQWSLAPLGTTSDPIFKERSKPASKQTVNEICSTADRIVELSDRVAKLAHSVKEQLKLDIPSWPPLPPIQP
ncbi:MULTISPECIES: hypothetical protein [Bradyrhizobium]|uniref:hypothetical protein n=2 Tax=Nitrobacteraceae TaxID=41294 RepID=UPI00155E2885|nr:MULTISPECIES: hypothetical protein [Bradyrhizobium]